MSDSDYELVSTNKYGVPTYRYVGPGKSPLEKHAAGLIARTAKTAERVKKHGLEYALKYGAGHDMTLHGEGKPHPGTE